MPVRTIPLDTFRAELAAQGVSSREHFAFKCPMCGTVQSGRDLMNAAEKSFDEIETRIAFDCVGRFTGAGGPRNKPDGKPCNWTLGGLFRTHKLEVVTPDGKKHPMFEPASAEEAQAHERLHSAEAA